MAIKVRLKDEDLGEVDFEQFTISDAYLVKGASGLTPKALFVGIEELDPLALQTLVWFLRKKQGNTAVPLKAIDFKIGEIDIDDDEDHKDVDGVLPADPTAAVGTTTSPAATSTSGS